METDLLLCDGIVRTGPLDEDAVVVSQDMRHADIRIGEVKSIDPDGSIKFEVMAGLAERI